MNYTKYFQNGYWAEYDGAGRWVLFQDITTDEVILEVNFLCYLIDTWQLIEVK